MLSSVMLPPGDILNRAMAQVREQFPWACTGDVLKYAAIRATHGEDIARETVFPHAPIPTGRKLSIKFTDSERALLADVGNLSALIREALTALVGDTP